MQKVEFDKEAFINRILSLIGDKPYAWAKQHHIDRSVVDKLKRGSVPGAKYILELANALGVTADYLLTGKESPIVREPEGTEGEEFVYVPVVRGEIAAGAGLVPDNTVEIRIAFRADWIRRHGDPRKMSLIRVSGDSMEPTLYSGDLVLVDHDRNYLDPAGGLYAITMRDEDLIMVKRLQLLWNQKKVKIISDNQRYEPLIVKPEEIIINGKVIWFCREIER